MDQTARQDPSPADLRAAQSLVSWLAGLGVSEFVQEGPRDRFAETLAETQARAERRGANRGVSEQVAAAAAAPAVSRTPAGSAAPPSGAVEAPVSRPSVPAYDGTLSDADAIDEGRARSREASTLEDLEAALAGFTGCALRLTARSLVFGGGAADADLMLVGEAPGREEDKIGTPFVGREGRLLDAMLAAIGLKREAVRLANMVFWRPPGDRSATPSEAAICMPFVMRQIELVRPKVLVCLDAPTARLLLGREEDIMRLRGSWSELALDDHAVAVTATLSPAHLLRHANHKHLVWRDLQAIGSRLGAG